eukprot:s575_g37.t1
MNTSMIKEAISGNPVYFGNPNADFMTKMMAPVLWEEIMGSGRITPTETPEEAKEEERRRSLRKAQRQRRKERMKGLNALSPAAPGLPWLRPVDPWCHCAPAEFAAQSTLPALDVKT